MRMWMIPPIFLCNKHLYGAHGEIHKHRHNFVKQHSIEGRIKPFVQIEPSSMKTRHDELAKEILIRKGNHNSLYEMPDISYLPEEYREAKVDIINSYIDLIDRCSHCRKRILAGYKLGKIK